MTTDTKRGLTKEEREFAAKHSTDYELAKVLCEDLDAAEEKFDALRVTWEKCQLPDALEREMLDHGITQKKLEAAEERERVLLKALREVREQVEQGVEIYCDVNPEDCDHCVVLGMIDEALTTAKEGS